MSEIIPTLRLLKNSTCTPVHYRLEVELPTGTGYEIDTHGPVNTTPNADNNLEVDVAIIEDQGGNQSITIDLGGITPPAQGGIEVSLFAGSTFKGKNVILVEDAQEDSK